jgi:hypothetical protein
MPMSVRPGFYYIPRTVRSSVLSACLTPSAHAIPGAVENRFSKLIVQPFIDREQLLFDIGARPLNSQKTRIRVLMDSRAVRQKMFISPKETGACRTPLGLL